MKKILLLLAILPSCLMAQEKIGNKIYKYGDLYHAIEGTSLISFEKADAKSMSKTLDYFAKARANVKSMNSLFLPGSNVTEDEFSRVLDENKIETLIVIDIIDSSEANMTRTTSSAYATVNKKKEISSSSSSERSGSSSSQTSGSSSYGRSSSSGNASYNAKAKLKSTSSSGSSSITKNSNYTTEMSLRLTIFSKKDSFKAPVAVVEGRATNGSPDTTDEQIARRIVRRMVKALDEQRAF